MTASQLIALSIEDAEFLWYRLGEVLGIRGEEPANWEAGCQIELGQHGNLLAVNGKL